MGHKKRGSGGTAGTSWVVRQRTEGGVWYVRLPSSLGGRELSTGVSGSSPADRRKATSEGARIVATEIARGARPKQAKPTAGARGGAQGLERLIASWLHSLKTTHQPTTRTTWEGYGSAHFLPHFVDAAGLTQERCAAYIKERLAEVLAVTVRKELTALRSLLEWALIADEIGAPEYARPRPADPNQIEQWARDVVQSMVPGLPRRARGTPHPQRRRVAAFEISPEQAQAVLRGLPEWSKPGHGAEQFAVRARFIVAYETSLRPSTLDRITTPEHYRIGADRLRLTDDTDKARFGRDVPLTRRARRVLDHLLRAYERRTGAPYTGPIFGHHDHRNYIRAAAERALPPSEAERFTGCHFRAHRITHLLEGPEGTLPGTQHMAGHKLVSTTAKYVKPSFRAARETLGERERKRMAPKDD